MAQNDTIGDRMKRYEVTSQSSLINKLPVIARIDGAAFHTFTKRIKDLPRANFNGPFSERLHDVMVATTEHLVTSLQGCVFGYTQSDEISLVFRDWDTIQTAAWFDYNVQKMCSHLGARASNAFNFYYAEKLDSLHYAHRVADLAVFDARVHNVPALEVENYMIWRQQDASRNSIQMLGHYWFSQKEMHGLNNSQVQEKLWSERDVNWNSLPTWAKRGSAVVKSKDDSGHTRVVVDKDIPIFTQDRQYVRQVIYLETN